MHHDSPMRTVVLVILALTPVAGCGPKSELTLVPVEGRVTLDGEPARACVVTFQLADAHAKMGPQAVGVTDGDGRFEARSSGNRLGVVAGMHRVFVVPGDVVSVAPEAGPAGQATSAAVTPSPVPARYRSPGSSGLEATVTPDSRNSFLFELHSRPQ